MNAGKVMASSFALPGRQSLFLTGTYRDLSGKAGWGEVYILGCVASWVAYSLIGKVIMKDLSLCMPLPIPA